MEGKENGMLYTIQTPKSKAVVSTYGGEMHSYSHMDADGENAYLWSGDRRFWDEHAPVLFPVVCTPKDMKMAHDGVEYPMMKHGFASTSEFTPVLQTPDTVAFALEESADSLAMFPFHFRLENRYTVTDTGFSAAFTVTNRDSRPMTYCIGGHPGFRLPLYAGDRFSDYDLVFTDATGAYVTGTANGLMDPALPHLDKIRDNVLHLSYETFGGDTLIIQNLPVKQVRLVNRYTGRGILFTFDGLEVLGLWTMSDERSPFVCLEPWNGLPASSDETTDARSKKYARTLTPGSSHTVNYSVNVIPGTK